ncbi:hypothetical protein F5887DRAFT_296289 [Amanita rubescens]|nr:hypothetical protein F5887DRAFT_296289 [Amanita rubescens]
MPPRKRAKPNPSRNFHREAKNDAHLTHSHTVQSQSAVGYNGPLTRSRRLRSHLPPIYCLPPEVLGEIFILALPTDQEIHMTLQFYGSGELLTNPLIFSAVCSSWRLLAFSIPQLWRRISIKFLSNLTVTRAENKAAVLVQWILRSRSLPLTLHISRHYMNGIGHEAPITSVLNDYAARWESLYFKDLQRSSHLFRFDGWPLLRRLYFPCVSPTSEAVPWAQLTHLQIQRYMSCQEAEIIFMKCPKLVHLSISVDSWPIGSASVPITLYDLVTFSLKASNLLGRLVDQLSLPSLRECSISEPQSEDVGSLLNLFTRSSCTLDKLEIRVQWGLMRSHDYVKILAHRSCSSLGSLAILCLDHRDGTPAYDEILRGLALNSSETLCTHLKFLVIDYCFPTSLLSALLNMVESRIKPHDDQAPELQYLRLHVKYLKGSMKELDKIGRTNGNRLEYSREPSKLDCCRVRFRRGGIEAPPNFSELLQS